MAQFKKSTLFFGVAVLAVMVAAVKFLIPSKSEESGKPVMTTNDSQLIKACLGDKSDES